ncbi:MAG: PSD1 and planctomycete cytochrome C domain-containing protein [Bryobacteraceae bacterium]|nr:PSD1 and planctomycete cytochrome C domain-containing protein [Bryobacteraceae bacterium]
MIIRSLSVYLLVSAAVSAQNPAEIEFFEKKVRPVLATKCQACHNAKTKTSGLDLTTVEGFRTGSSSGPLVSKENPESSMMLKAIAYDGKLKMPPMGRLSDGEITALTEWVKMGAPWPGAGSAAASASAVRKGGRNFSQEEKSFWAFQPVKDPQVPRVKDVAWVKSPVDNFILAQLEAKGLKPAPPADKLTLLRRATYDLTGLPPGEKEIAEFLSDNSPQAFAKVVDRLLNSPRYGERWGRHWLDVARYADSTGNDEDHRYPYAWRYRDYVIDAFNSDLPYDQFVREQIAGDLMKDKGVNGLYPRGIVATGFLALGAKAIAQQDKKKMLYDVYDEQLDVFSKGFLGVTLSCARCHDHKFDPLLQKDYYSIVNFFANTKSFSEADTHVSKLLYTPLVSKQVYAAYKAHEDKINQTKMRMDDVAEGEKERYNKDLTPRLADYMLAARQVASGGNPDQIASARQLKPGVLKRWVEYLKTDPRTKPHFDDWAKATDANVAEVAAKYQATYTATMAKWSKTLARWREESRRMLAEMNMPPRPKPMFKAEEDGFFYDVYIDAKIGPFALSEKDQDRVFSAEAKQAMARLKAELEQLKASKPPEPDMACAVEEEDTPVSQKIFVRGDYNNPGEDAPKAFPLILAKPADPRPGEAGSGRLALADWVASKDNPLSTRVIANRIWHWHFNEGIVRTPDNFGKMGERPTHPELLDWLTSRFIANGWSFKKMHRMLMLSSTYQMASTPSEQALQADPENRLFSRFFRRRMSVEEIRDGLLAVDNSIDFKMGGTLQSGFGTDGENNQDRLSINPETQKIRSVYLPLRRANLPTLLNLYDFGDATTVQGRRISTNVAPQTLFMMNSTFVTDRTRNLAGAVLSDERLSDAQRLERVYLRAVNRRPDAGEVDSALTYITRFQKTYPGAHARQDAWQSFCRALIASNEFIYVD